MPGRLPLVPAAKPAALTQYRNSSPIRLRVRSPGACLSRASPGGMSFTGWCATIERQPMHDSNSRESRL